MSKLEFEHYFPTIIAYADWADFEPLNHGLVTEIYNLRVSDPEGIERSNVKNVGGWHSQTDLHRKDAFKAFTDRVIATVQDYANGLDFDEERSLVCDSMWANINQKYSYNRYHNHGDCLLSGVYYVQVPSGDAGRINFFDPRLQATFHPKYSEQGQQLPHSWTKVFYEPLPGRIILFPSWLNHDVEPNLSDDDGEKGDRISISFNFYQRRLNNADAT